MTYRVWYSTLSLADFIIDNTVLRNKSYIRSRIYESDANNPSRFHSMPDHIKKILYLDSPDIIVEKESEPIFSIEVSTEAGTGHNVFQRFARLAASVENDVPAFYIYPEAKIVTRTGSPQKWDILNPLIFKALDDVMTIYGIPALLYYFPSLYNGSEECPLNDKNSGLLFDSNIKYAGCPEGEDEEIRRMFKMINEVIEIIESDGVLIGRSKLISKRSVIDKRAEMQQRFAQKGGSLNSSPLSATIRVPTNYLLNHLMTYVGGDYQIGELLRSRSETIIYQVDAKFRGDPYPGALAAIDYLVCREGKTFEDRKYNLVLAWGKVDIDVSNDILSVTGSKGDIDDFFAAVQSSENRNILSINFNNLAAREIPRYYMQVRYGSMFSKVKHLRVFAYFADAILFPNGALWRDG